MSNLAIVLYILDIMNCHHTCDKRDNFWVIETKEKQLWFDEQGEYYGTITKILELEDC